MDYSCPNCGAPIKFLSSISVYTTCAHCNSMVVRRDMNLETFGRVAELLRDMSPFQVGTMGRFEGKGFTLAGRIKVMYEKGMWSEWWAMFDDGSEGWLAEAQGFYMMSFPSPEAANFPSPDSLNTVGQEVRIGNDFYRIDDVKKVTYAASEGELPFIFQPKMTGVSIDLRSAGGKFASIFFSQRETQLFIGKYLPFEAFQFINLREIDGWVRK